MVHGKLLLMTLLKLTVEEPVDPNKQNNMAAAERGSGADGLLAAAYW